MLLSELIGQTPPADGPVTRVVEDSRDVASGDVFIFDARSHPNGDAFIAMAHSKGAAAIITNLSPAPDIPNLIHHPEPGRLLARWALATWPKQPQHLVGVTGTNGKTSVTWFYQQLVHAATGDDVAGIGTLGVFRNNELVEETGYTSPTALKLHPVLDRLAAGGVRHACMEVSSIALDLHRLEATNLRAGALTNITSDHLDFHGSLGAYFAAKQRMFTELLPDGAAAVLPVQRPEAWPIAAAARERGLCVLTVGTANAELTVSPVEMSLTGMTVAIKYGETCAETHLPLIGAFQAGNLAVAMGLALASDVPFTRLVQGLRAITSPPGRMELFTAPDGAPSVVVDYAHTADALDAVLTALRPFVPGKLWVVFGCGGDRDPAKRPAMGAVAARLADHVLITDDNPRSEDPAAIRAAITAAAPEAATVPNRAEAIHKAVQAAGGRDMVLIAGKGHETGQIFSTYIDPHDDRTVVRQALAARVAA